MSTPTMEQHAIANGQTFVWHQLDTPNMELAVKFYTEGLGFGTQDIDGPMGPYKMFTKNGIPVAGAMDTNIPEMEGVPPHWAVFLAVDDVDARIAKSQEHGATLVVPAMDVPTVGRMGLIQDPAGAHIWLFKVERS